MQEEAHVCGSCQLIIDTLMIRRASFSNAHHVANAKLTRPNICVALRRRNLSRIPSLTYILRLFRWLCEEERRASDESSLPNERLQWTRREASESRGGVARAPDQSRRGCNAVRPTLFDPYDRQSEVIRETA